MSKSVKMVSYENSASFGSKSDEGFIQDGMQACFNAPTRFWMVSTENDAEHIRKEVISDDKVGERISNSNC